MPKYGKYRCFENSKHVLSLKVERLKELSMIRLTATKGNDLASVIGGRLCEESKDLVEITLYRKKYGDSMNNLIPDTSHASEGFFTFLQRHLHEETPIMYEYHLGAFYVHAREELVTRDEVEFFKGIGHNLLCWLLNQIDVSGESVFALEADGSPSVDPETKTAEQKSLVAYYKNIGFKVCAKEEDHSRFYNASVCMYGKFSDIIQRCNHSRFDIKPITVFDGF